MYSYFALGIVCIVLIIIVYWAFINNDSAKRRRAERLYQESGGNFDDNAKSALTELTRIDNPEPGDLFRRGNIFEYNILEGNLNQRFGPIRDPTERRTVVGNIVRDYTDALRGMRRTRVANPDFMLHHMEEFGNRARVDLDDDMLNIWLNGFHETLNNVGPEIRQETIDERVGRAVAAADDREQAIDNYFKDAVKFTSDAQNVHDSKVNSELRATLQKLRNSTPNVNVRANVANCRKYIQDEYIKDPDNRQKATNALRILDVVSQGNTIGTFNDTEDHILALVWERCKHPRNEENADLMREAIANSLADGVENGSPVCINGRCTRILNSLVKLDYDDNMGKAMTYEMFKSQIFNETQEILKQEIARAKDSTDADLRTVGESYEGKNVDTNPATEQQFKDAIKREIDQNFERYTEKLTPAEIGQIKQECYAAVEI
jgi:hypothetical protein